MLKMQGIQVNRIIWITNKEIQIKNIYQESTLVLKIMT